MKIELDDLILEHPKFVLAIQLAGSDAWFLWSGLRAYCSRFLTDGEVPLHMIGEVRGPKDPEQRQRALDALKTARLVDETANGIALHDYLDWAASRDQVLAWRKANSDRKKASRSKSSAVRSTQNDHMSRCDSAVTPLVVTVGVTAESACSHGGSHSGVPAPSPSQISHSDPDTSDEVSKRVPAHVHARGPAAPTQVTALSVANENASQSNASPSVASDPPPPATTEPPPVSEARPRASSRPDPFRDSFVGPSPGAVELFGAYRSESGKTGLALDHRAKELFDRLNHEGVTADEIRECVRGAKLDDWGRDVAKLSPSAILGSSEQRDKFRSIARNPPKPKGRQPPQPNDERNRYVPARIIR